jgi:tetratricopeptide (TPR) repeat protein
MSVRRIENNYGVFLSDFKGTKYFAHSGGNEGFVCYYIGSVEDGNGLAVMTNGNNFKLIEEILLSIASLNQWKNYPIEPQKESIGLTIRKECLKNIDKGIALYKDLKKNKPNDYNFSNENELNELGYEFLKDNQLDAALKIFDLNVNEFPKSGNVYDSRGEAYFNKKEYALSKSDYQKSLELDPTNNNAKEMILKINQIFSTKN